MTFQNSETQDLNFSSILEAPNSKNISENGLRVTYQLFGLPIGNSPVVVVVHPLTGDSNVAGENGWWKDLVGNQKAIDTEKYTVISFDIPGNGIQNNYVEDYQAYHVGDIAKRFLEVLADIGISSGFAVIGCSIGAGIAWEMTAQAPDFFEKLVPVCGDWKSTDWVIASTFVQSQILENHSNPIEVARMHAMMSYRTPLSMNSRFQREVEEGGSLFQSESWLVHHGDSLQKRYSLKAYKAMNHFLGKIDALRGGLKFEDVYENIKSHVHIISVNSDLLFIPQEDLKTVDLLNNLEIKNQHHVIKSDFGHDAFLIETKSISDILNDIF